MYTSTVSVLVSSVGTAETTTSEAYQGTLLAEQRMASYADVVRGPTLAKNLVDELKLDVTPRQLEDRIDVLVPKATTVLRISVDDADPDRAQQIASRAGASIVTVIGDLEKTRGQGTPLLRARVAGEATVPAAATAPPSWRNPTLGLAGGLAIGLALAVIRPRLDRRIRDETGVRETLGAPVLGTLPTPRWRPGGIGQTYDGKRYDSAVAQLRTSIYFLHPGPDQCLTLAITSPRPVVRLPKIASEVAAALVDAGARVLLVDADLDQPHQAPLLGAEADGSPGLVDYLTADSTVDDVVYHHAVSGVDVLPAGTPPTNPADLLHSEALARLLKEAAHRYDVVLVMATPTSLGTAAAAVAARCDGTVMVLARRGTSRRQVRTALTQLDRVDAPVLGGVFLS